MGDPTKSPPPDNGKRKSPPQQLIDDDVKALPSNKKPLLQQQRIDGHFWFNKEKISKNTDIILKEAPKADVVGIKYHFEQSIRHKNLAEEASKNQDWDAAEMHYEEFKKSHAQASFELSLFENCKWAVGYATNMIENFQRKCEFGKCKEMDRLRSTAQAFLDLVGEIDIEFIKQREAAASSKKMPSSSTAISASANVAAATPLPPSRTTTVTPPIHRVIHIDTEPDEGTVEGTAAAAVTATTPVAATATATTTAADTTVAAAATTNEDEDHDDDTEFAEAPKASCSRNHVSQKYVGKADCTPRITAKPPSKARFDTFMKKTSHKCYVQQRGRKACVMINPSKEPYILSHGYLYCNACKVRVDWERRGNHAVGKKHSQNKAERESNLKATEEQRKKSQSRIREEQLVGRNSDDEKIDGALNFLKYAFASNSSINAVVENRGALMQISDIPVPGYREMTNRIPDLQAWHLDKIKEACESHFPEFSFILDATPLFAECECVVLRIVDKDFNIHEYVIHLEMYAEALNGENVAKHIENTVKKIDLDWKNWRATMLDRAKTNKKATRLLKEKYKVNPLDVWCASHGTSGCGKKAKYPEGKRVLRGFSRMVKHSLCKARNVFRYCFGESAKKLSGVRWGIEHEMAEQVNRLTIDDMRDEYVRECESRGYSEKATAQVLDLTKDVHDTCVASCQIAAVVDAGEPLVKSTYTNESKQPNVLVIHENIADMKEKYARGTDFYDFPRLDKECLIAEEKMKDLLAPMQQEIDDAKALLDAAREKEATAKAALDTALSNAAAPANNRQRQNARQNYAQMANPNTQTVPDAFQADNALQEAYDTAKEETSAAKDSHDAKVKELDDYKLDHCTTYDDFFEVGIRAVKPIFDDVRRNFLSPNGDYYDLYGAYIAASVFDVTVVGAMNQDQIVDKINDLRKFGFDEFRDVHGIRDYMIEEIPAYLALVNATPEEYFERVDGAEEYDKNLREKQESEDPDIAAKYAGLTWKDDRIEKARRVWEWWKTYHHKLTYFSTAVRLVVLVQTSSASVERVFSQVKFIVEAIGECALESTLETRLMCRINNYDD